MHSSKMNYSGEPNKYIIIDKNASVKGSHHDSFRKYLSAVAEMLSKLPFLFDFHKQLSGSVLRIVSIFFSTSFSLVQLLVGDVPRCRRIAISAGKRLISVSILIAAHLFRGFPSGGRRGSLFFCPYLRFDFFPIFLHSPGIFVFPPGSHSHRLHKHRPAEKCESHSFPVTCSRTHI